MSDTVSNIAIRRLNDEGIAYLRNRLADIRRGDRGEDKLAPLVEDPQYTTEIEDGGVLDGNQQFPNQMDMINYFKGQLGEEFIVGHRKDKGFWSWVSLLYWRQLLKEAKSPGTDACWIYEPDNYRAFRRHYFAGAIYLSMDFEKCCAEAKEMLFSAKLTAFSGMRDAITYNQEVARIPAFMEVVSWLYHNPATSKKIKAGSSTQDKPGTIRDLIHVIRQFSKTRDFYEVEDAVELWDLLPEQFEKFKGKAAH